MTDETDKIEQDINRSRSALNDTIERLGGKLSPGQMVDEAIGLAQGQLGQFTANLGKQVRDNPLPLLLIGAGVGMLVMKNLQGKTDNAPSLAEDDWRAEHHFRKIEQARAARPRDPDESESDYQERLHEEHAKALDLKQMAGEAYDAFKARVARTVEGLERRAAGVRDAVAGGVSHAGAYVGEQAKHVGEMAGQVKHKATDLYEENPLAAGAIGVAVGALIGALAPLSSLERKNLKGVADTAMQTGADLAERGASAVEKATSNIVH